MLCDDLERWDGGGEQRSRGREGFPGQLSGKESACNAGATRDVGLIPGSGRSPGGGNGNLLQYSCLEYPMDRGACWATVHGVAKDWTRLNQLNTAQHSGQRHQSILLLLGLGPCPLQAQQEGHCLQLHPGAPSVIPQSLTAPVVTLTWKC